MAGESLRILLGKRKELPPPPATQSSRWRSRLPFLIHYQRSGITISGVLPLAIGFGVGILVSMMGVGGGFFLIPAMIYLLGMPTAVVIGTSLYQIMFITAHVTLLQAITTQTVDIVLALLLLSGSVFGAQAGSKIGAKLPTEHLRGLLALLVLAVAIKLAYGLVVTPADPYTVDVQ